MNGFSKAFAMTGWRIGAVIAPQIISEKITLISESIVSCVPGFVQDAAKEALLAPIELTSEMYAAYRRRQLMFVKEFELTGVMQCNVPQGAMYIFPSIKDITNDSVNFALHLLETTGIACVPGAFFGSNGEGHLRFSCAGVEEDISGINELIRSAAELFEA